MHSQVTVAASPNRLARIDCRGAVAARRTRSATVHFVSAAITPLGGDTIEIRVVVEPGARLKLRSAAASMALPGAISRTSHANWQIDVAGELDVDLEPMIVAADARHFSSIALRLHAGGSVRFRDRIQIGRSGEREGFWSGSLRVDRDHRPLVRHRVELGAGSLADDVLSAPRAAVSEFCYPEPPSPELIDPRSTVLALAGGGALSYFQSDRLVG